jgi:hypothetical protein
MFSKVIIVPYSVWMLEVGRSGSYGFSQWTTMVSLCEDCNDEAISDLRSPQSPVPESVGGLLREDDSD